MIYGTTFGGGVDSDGTIFSYNSITNKEIDLHDFGSGLDGVAPGGSLIQVSDSFLYGMTEAGGTVNTTGGGGGTIFRYNISTGIETVVHDFGDGIDGVAPLGNLLEVDSPTITTYINQSPLNQDQLSIYPNPTSGQFIIKSIGNQNGYSVEVYNIVGEEVYQSIFNSSQTAVDLSAQPQGMYFVYLKSEKSVEVGKILVTK